MKFTSYIDSKYFPAVSNLFVLFESSRSTKELLNHFSRHIDNAMNVVLLDIAQTAKFEMLPVGYTAYENYVLRLTDKIDLKEWLKNDRQFSFFEIDLPKHDDKQLSWVMHVSMAMNRTFLQSSHIERNAQQIYE